MDQPTYIATIGGARLEFCSEGSFELASARKSPLSWDGFLCHDVWLSVAAPGCDMQLSGDAFGLLRFHGQLAFLLDRAGWGRRRARGLPERIAGEGPMQLGNRYSLVAGNGEDYTTELVYTRRNGVDVFRLLLAQGAPTRSGPPAHGLLFSPTVEEVVRLNGALAAFFDHCLEEAEKKAGAPAPSEGNRLGILQAPRRNGVNDA